MYVLADLYSQDELEIKPAIKQEKVVLKERHVDSILACQIPKIIDDYPVEDSEQLFRWLNQASTYLTDPGLTFFLQVKDKTLKERIEARGELACENDFIVFRKRQAIYNRLAVEKKKRWVTLNNDGSFSDAVQTIITHIHCHRKITREEI
jgi:thymidylate kinase